MLKKVRFAAIGFVILLAGCQTSPTPLPLAGNPFAPVSPTPHRVGDTYVYHYADGYGNLEGGKVSYKVDKIEGGRIVMSVTPEVRREGPARTEIYTRDGNWLRRPLSSHDRVIEMEFAPAYPAYAFPLEPGKSWSMRVSAVNQASGRRHNILVESTVVGAERIRVPAGEFDTIKIRRYTYLNDMESFLARSYPTRVSEIDWYAPALGRSVRIESDSEWSVGFAPPEFRTARGDWSVYELVSAPSTVQ